MIKAINKPVTPSASLAKDEHYLNIAEPINRKHFPELYPDNTNDSTELIGNINTVSQKSTEVPEQSNSTNKQNSTKLNSRVMPSTPELSKESLDNRTKPHRDKYRL